MKRYVMDGAKVIQIREEIPGDKSSSGEQAAVKTPECTFEALEVYAVDMCMTSAEGKPREGDLKTTIFKRCVDVYIQISDWVHIWF